jgi:hypothetical protein
VVRPNKDKLDLCHGRINLKGGTTITDRSEVDLLLMITRDKFDFIKEKYGYFGSWAIWANEDDKPKSNIGDLTVLDPDINKNLLSQLDPNVVLVGLNISRGDIKIPLANFHDKRLEATDYKIRYAFRGSPYWGGYMTDIIKNFDQKISSKVDSYLKKNRDFEVENIQTFLRELKDIGANNPTLIAFGNISYEILNRNLNNEFKILKVPHYANYTNKDKYREQVKEIW